MKRMIKYNSIDQMINCIYSIKREIQYTGKDEDGEAIYDENIKLPIVNVELWEKIHGTNASVCYSNPDGFWVQSRKSIITEKKDNLSTAKMAYENEKSWMNIINRLAKAHNIDLNEKIISVYYEQAGKGIQKHTAVKGMDKLAIIFAHFKVSPLEPSYDKNKEETGAFWLPTVDEMKNPVSENENRIFNIIDFENHKMILDFNNPEEFKNKVMKMIDKIEESSPVGEKLGTKGNVGEGYVITFELNGNIHKFKLKGEKHGKGSGGEKVELTAEEIEEQKIKIDFVNKNACPEWRLSQMYDETFGKEKPTMKDIGKYLKALFKDVEKEETIALKEIGLVPKDISKLVSTVGKNYIVSRIEKEAGL